MKGLHLTCQPIFLLLLSQPKCRESAKESTDRSTKTLNSDKHNVVCQEDISGGHNSHAPLPLCSDVNGLPLGDGQQSPFNIMDY